LGTWPSERQFSIQKCDILLIPDVVLGGGEAMRRREFIAFVGGMAVARPLAVRAQQVEKMRTLGMLLPSADSDQEFKSDLQALLLELEKLGWKDGRNVKFEYRWGANDAARIREFARELVRMAPDVLFASSTPPSSALHLETNSIPIVFVQVADPIGPGFIASLAGPGGNMTGLTNFEPSIGGKWLETLKEIAPQVQRVALLFNPQTAPGAGSYFLHPIENVAASFGVQTIEMPLRNVTESEPALKSFAQNPNGGLVFLGDAFTAQHHNHFIKLTAQYHLPAVYPFSFFVTEGGLISYGPNRTSEFRRAAAYIDLILRGAKPADLPVQTPINFELVVNRKTARALGLDVPGTLVAHADRVIE
jgi:putative ABC transport system substrate-binding protein